MSDESITADIRDRLLGEASLLDAHTASWVVHLPPLLRDAAAEIERLREIEDAHESVMSAFVDRWC